MEAIQTQIFSEKFSEGSIQKRLSYFFAPGSVKYDIDGLYVFEWESDKLLWTKSGYIYEFEIKISRSDFKNDFKHKVDKHAILSGEKYMPDTHKHYEWNKHLYPSYDAYLKHLDDKSRELVKNHRKPNYFYYAVPEGMIQVEEVPEYAGLIWLLNDYRTASTSYMVKKKAPALHKEKYKDGELNLAEKFYYNWESDRRLRREAQRRYNDVYTRFREELDRKGQEYTYEQLKEKYDMASSERNEYQSKYFAAGREERLNSMIIRRLRHAMLELNPDFDYNALEQDCERTLGINR